MDSRNPGELITEVKEEQQTRGELATEALQWFLDDNVGELFPRSDVVDILSNELDITNSQANTAISDTVGDIVDPVQQIVKSNKKYVGVIDYKIFNDEGAYGYVDFDDRKGQRKRVACARCVEKHTYDENINHATQGEGSSNKDATWQRLLNQVTGHYADNHIKPPSDIEPGASLVSGTTISGNTAFHSGNESNIDHNNLSNRTHSGDDLSPSSVSSTTLEAGTSITDPADNTITDFVGGDLTLDNGTLKAITSPDVRTSLNDLFVRNAEQDFELGLAQLNYRDGQFEVFANDSKIASSTNLNLILGSPLDDKGYVHLNPARVTNVTPQQDIFTGSYPDDRVVGELVFSSPDLLASDNDGVIYKIDVGSMTLIEKNRPESNKEVSTMDADSSFAYFSNTDRDVFKLDVDTMDTVGEHPINQGPVFDVFVKGDFVYSTHGDKQIIKTDTATMSGQGTFDAHTETGVCLHVSDEFGYSGHRGANVRKWDVATMSAQENTVVDSFLQFTAIGGDADHIYAGADNGRIYKFDSDTLNVQTDTFTHTAEIVGLETSPNLVFTASFDETVRMYDKETLTEQEKFTGHSGSLIRSVTLGEKFCYSASDPSASPSPIIKHGDGFDARINGNVEHVQQDIGFVPNTAVISDDLRQLPTGTDVHYEIADDAGNSVTVQRSDIDGGVDVSALSSSVVSTTAYLERPDADTDSPQLDSWALYLNE